MLAASDDLACVTIFPRTMFLRLPAANWLHRRSIGAAGRPAATPIALPRRQVRHWRGTSRNGSQARRSPMDPEGRHGNGRGREGDKGCPFKGKHTLSRRAAEENDLEAVNEAHAHTWHYTGR